MRYTFTAWGHPKITGTHRNTIEFTKAKEMGKEADCIIGVKADFEKELLKNFLQECRAAASPQIKMDLKAGEQREFLYFKPNPVFDDENEIVLRISNFCSKRTLGVQATKSARYLSRAFVSRLSHPEQEIVVTLTGMG
ncbi:DUF371 domain-containing protein [Candidatus Woesearchaeota archaeon]|nr:DUF371 domain-containing protein [Candidatus Woesearchaeota archaeon]